MIIEKISQGPYPNCCSNVVPDKTSQRRLLAAEIFGKLKAMEHHASPPSSLIWLWLLISFGEPLITFETALSKCRSDYRKEFSVLGAVIVHHFRYPSTTVGGVEGLILFLSGLGSRYSILGHKTSRYMLNISKKSRWRKSRMACSIQYFLLNLQFANCKSCRKEGLLAAIFFKGLEGDGKPIDRDYLKNRIRT